MEYRREVDGLRAVAVVSVVLFHAGFEVCSGGYVGVDVFFVISGFLIAGTLDRKPRFGFSLADFYERRMRRILPALFLVMAVCVLPAVLMLAPEEFERFSTSLAATTLYLSNVYFWSESGYFAPAAEEQPLLHTWSLAVEEQYYLIFPLLLIALRNRSRRTLLISLLVAWLLSLAACEWGSERMPGATFYLAPFRAWEILTGALLALGPGKRLKALPRVFREAGGVVGLGLIITSVALLDADTPFPSVWALLPTIGSALVILGAWPDTAVGRLLALRPFVAVGLLSYSFYLWHHPVFAFARLSQIGEPTKATFVMLSACSLALAALSWKFVEQPFRRRGFLSRKEVFGLSFGASVCFVALGAAGLYSKGFPGRFSPEQQAVFASARSSPMRDECHSHGPGGLAPDDACVYGASPERPVWAVLGDSHVVELAFALGERVGREEGVLHLSRSGCPPALTYEAERVGCTGWTKDAFAFLKNTPSIQNVVVGYRHSYHLFGGGSAFDQRRPEILNEGNPDALRDLYLGGFAELIRGLAQDGRTVYVLTPVPELDADIDKYVRLGGQTSPPGRRVAEYETRNRLIRSAAVELAENADSVVLVDVADVLCDDSRCHSVADGEALYFDDNHLSIAGAARVVELVLEQRRAGSGG